MSRARSCPRVVVGLALAGCLGVVGPMPAGGADVVFKVIVPAGMTVASAKRETLSAVYLKKALRWGDGTPAQPVDQSAGAPLREAFSRYVHGQPLGVVMKYWMTQIADGRGVPPPVKASDEEVIAFVASRQGSVGYVTAGTPLPGTVRVLQVVD